MSSFASARLESSKEQLVSLFSEGDISETFPQSYTELVDRYFRSFLEESETGHRLFRGKNPFALVAVGGYGRKELCLNSDIDILILFKSRLPSTAKKLAEELFYPLWDMGMDLGYGVRSIRDCIRLAADDFEVLTSLMDARFVGGDSPLFLSLVESVQDKIIKKKAGALKIWFEAKNKGRMDIFGDASYMLEPNLKEGIGGLRDYHQILWLSKAFFKIRTPRDLEFAGILSHKEYEALKEQLNFIWLARNRLHHLSGRKNDRLAFEYQEEIAKELGYRNKRGFLGVEQFLGDLHACMGAIKSLRRSFINTQLPGNRMKSRILPFPFPKGIHISQGELEFDSATAIIKNPMLLLEIFEQAGALLFPLSMEAKRLAREFRYLVDESFINSRDAAISFGSLLENRYASHALDQLFETNLLEAFIPEFAPVKDRVQFDAYHTYPVGRHLLEAVKNLKELPRRKELLLLEIYSNLPDKEALILAALLHDIGKTGKDHSSRGAALAARILNRMGYPKKKVKMVSSLIRNHLLLAETATRRDLNDEKIIVDCAAMIGDVETLKMLYLLTWADSNATGPRAWNDWVANLVEELFFKVLHVLEKGELANPDNARRLRRKQSQIAGLMPEEIPESRLKNYFELMPPRYLLDSGAADISRHLEAVLELEKRFKTEGGNAFSFSVKKEGTEGFWQITLMAADRPGLFSDFSGILALNNINIFSSCVYTWRNGIAVDIFRTGNLPDPLHIEDTWERVQRDLKMSLEGNLSIRKKLAKKASPSLLSVSKVPSRAPQVSVDNNSSDFFTIIEVFADDKPGVLFQLSRVLYELGLDIRVARIATKADQIADIFYVLDMEGQKVDEENDLAKIKETLLSMLEKSIETPARS